MPKTTKIQGASNASGQIEPPDRYVTDYSPTFDGPVHCRDELTVAGNIGLFGGAAAAQQSNVADASTAHALNPTFSDTEVEAALDALGVKVNAIFDVLEAYGLMAGA